VVERVGRVGVNHQFNFGEVLAKTLHLLEIFAGLDLDLDALVAGIEFFFYGGGERVERIFNSNRNACGDFSARAAEKLPERNALLLSFGVPDGGFQRALGHIVAADEFEVVVNVGGSGEVFVFDEWPEMIAENGPSRFDGFGAVVGTFAGDAFGPAGHTVYVGFEQDDAAVEGHAAADLERGDQL